MHIAANVVVYCISYKINWLTFVLYKQQNEIFSLALFKLNLFKLIAQINTRLISIRLKYRHVKQYASFKRRDKIHGKIHG